MADNVEERVSEPQKRVACEVYSRIVGYLRPVQAWNEGKQQEFAERKMYAVPESVPKSPDLAPNAGASDRPAGGAGQQVE
jgi:hypothetical protein